MCLTLSAAVFIPLLAMQQAAPQERVRIGYATPSGQAAALWITQDAGFLERVERATVDPSINSERTEECLKSLNNFRSC
jgi:hypothetical protein